MAAAKASVADRVVPEEQFYDQATEDAHGAEQAAADNTRASRGTAKNDNLKSIASLLTTLVENIDTEQAACNTQNTNDDQKCTDDQTTAKVPRSSSPHRSLKFLMLPGYLHQDSRR